MDGRPLLLLGRESLQVNMPSVLDEGASERDRLLGKFTSITGGTGRRPELCPPSNPSSSPTLPPPTPPPRLAYPLTSTSRTRWQSKPVHSLCFSVRLSTSLLPSISLSLLFLSLPPQAPLVIPHSGNRGQGGILVCASVPHLPLSLSLS